MQWAGGIMNVLDAARDSLPNRYFSGQRTHCETRVGPLLQDVFS